MKTRLFFLSLICIFSYVNVWAQCPDNNSPSAPGIYPNPMPNGTQNVLYPATPLTVAFPTDTSFQANLLGFLNFQVDVTFTDYKLVNAGGLPIGLSFDTAACSQSGCQFSIDAQNFRGCVPTLAGTTTLVGVFHPELRFRRNGFFLAPQFPFPLPGFPPAGTPISLDSIPGALAGVFPQGFRRFDVSTTLEILDDPAFCDILPNKFHFNVCPNAAGNPANIHVTGADDYTWLPVDGLNQTTGANVEANPLQTTVYTVTGTGANCTGTNIITVEVKLPEVRVFSEAPAVCPDSSVKIWARGANSYTWAPAANVLLVNGDTAIVKLDQTTTFTVTGSVNGCSGQDTITVSVFPLPNNNLPVTFPAVVCNGQDASVTVGNSENGIIYILGDQNGLVGFPRPGNGGDINFNIPANNLNGGVNQFVVVALDQQTNCATPVGGVIVIDNKDASLINISGLPEVQCISDGIVINLDAQPAGGSFSVNGVPFNGNQLDISGLPYGPNTLSYSITEVCGDITRDSTFIVALFNAAFTASATTAGPGGSVSLSNTSEGDFPGATYQWKVNGEIVSTDRDFVFKVPQDAQDGATFVVELTISANGKCSSTSETQTITVDATAVDDLVNNSLFTLYPNPSQGAFTIKLTHFPAKISITDLTGKEIYRAEAAKSTHLVDLKGQKAGMYLVTIESAKGRITRKITLSN